MNANERLTRDLISRQASDWFVANRDGLAVEERDDFTAWLKASPSHIEEYLQIALIARDLPRACADPESSVEAVVARARARDRRGDEPLWRRMLESVRIRAVGTWQMAGAAAVLGVLCVGLALWRVQPTPHAVPAEEIVALHYMTRHGKQQTYRLADDSILHLNTDSSVTIRYGNSERLVVLDSGEAEFEVVHERQRAFRVEAGAAQVVDLGTKFDVRLANAATLVTVVEGRVAVALTAAPPTGDARATAAARKSVQVDAGEQISVSGSSWPPQVVRVEARDTTAWLRRQIIFDREPLERVASEFNRYAPKPIEIASPELRKLEISGVFATDDPDAFIVFLRSLDGVRVEVTATRIRVLQDHRRAAGAATS